MNQNNNKPICLSSKTSNRLQNVYSVFQHSVLVSEYSVNRDIPKYYLDRNNNYNYTRVLPFACLYHKIYKNDNSIGGHFKF